MCPSLQLNFLSLKQDLDSSFFRCHSLLCHTERHVKGCEECMRLWMSLLAGFNELLTNAHGVNGFVIHALLTMKVIKYSVIGPAQSYCIGVTFWAVNQLYFERQKKVNERSLLGLFQHHLHRRCRHSDTKNYSFMWYNIIGRHLDVISFLVIALFKPLFLSLA